MKIKNFLLIVLTVVSFIPVSQALAYVDPGTGRVLYSMFAPLIAVIISLLTVVAVFFRKILSFFKRLIKRTSR